MPEEQESTVEWGGDVGGVGDRLSRLTWVTDYRGPRGVGLGCALAGFGLLLASSLLPWMSIDAADGSQGFPSAPVRRHEFSVAQLPLNMNMTGYNLGWMATLALVGVALVVRPPLRRIVVTAGLGVLAGEVLVLAGIARSMSGGPNFIPLSSSSDSPITIGIGIYCAFAAAVVLAAALVFAGGGPRRRPVEPKPDEDVGLPPPMDLTVTPVPAYEHLPEPGPRPADR